MTRRLELQHRMRFNRVKAFGMRGDLRALAGRRFAPHAPVAQDRARGAMAGRADQAIVLPENEIAGGPCAGIKRIGVLDKARICR